MEHGDEHGSALPNEHVAPPVAPPPPLTANQRRYLRQKARGLCSCNRPARPGKATCENHPRGRRTPLPVGHCYNHPTRPGRDGTKRCPDCVLKHRDAQERRRTRLRSKGLCQICGRRPATNGISRCDDCRIRREMKTAA